MSAVTILSLFPQFFTSPLETGLLGKAVTEGLLRVDVVNLRDFSGDKNCRCDDYPYGGGSGMVLMAEPLFSALSAIRKKDTFVVLTTPSGLPLRQPLVKELAQYEDLCIICGHYEGVDQRVVERYVDLEVSIGDYVISGGEYAALVIIDAIARYIPGFMSNPESLKEESFENELLEYPQYTRPVEVKGLRVPEVLLSGNHAEIQKWRKEQSLELTRKKRPDLYSKYISRKKGVLE